MSKQGQRPGPPNTSGSGPVRLRQIALVAKDLAKSKELLNYVLGTEVIYIDPEVEQWGLNNFLLALGGEILEVVSPFKDGTAAGRTLDKRGDGGYMIIMQHPDAQTRREYIEKQNLAKVIFSHRLERSTMVQYHPKGIKGGVIPELDSHDATESNPTPLNTRFSPWHACGPDEQSYMEAMKRNSHLSLLGAVCRLAPQDGNGEEAATQWEQIFGIPRSRDLVAFSNARLGFIHGEEGKPDGIVSISIGVNSEEKRDGIFERAGERGLLENDGSSRWVNMLGIKWYFSLTGNDNKPQSKL